MTAILLVDNGPETGRHFGVPDSDREDFSLLMGRAVISADWSSSNVDIDPRELVVGALPNSLAELPAFDDEAWRTGPLD